MRKRLKIIIVAILAISAIALLLEPPIEDYFRFVFSDAVGPKFRFASLDFYKSMPASKRDSILVALLGDLDSVVVTPRLVQNAGLFPEVPRGTKLQFDSATVETVARYWRKMGYTSRFADTSKFEHEGGTSITISPIKCIGREMYVGIQRYAGPMAAAGLIYRIEKDSTGYRFVIAAVEWVS